MDRGIPVFDEKKKRKEKKIRVEGQQAEKKIQREKEEQSCQVGGQKIRKTSSDRGVDKRREGGINSILPDGRKREKKQEAQRKKEKQKTI